MGGSYCPIRKRGIRHAFHCPDVPHTVQTHTLPPDEDIENLTDDEVDRTGALYNNLSGLYLYNGHFQGIFSRLGPFPTISKDLKGITAATIRVRG